MMFVQKLNSMDLWHLFPGVFPSFPSLVGFNFPFRHQVAAEQRRLEAERLRLEAGGNHPWEGFMEIIPSPLPDGGFHWGICGMMLEEC